MVKGVFFDFNGTLYFDQVINKITWKETIDTLSNNKIDFESFFAEYCAVMDCVVIADAFKLINKEYTDKDIEYWSNYKEERYRQYGLQRNMTKLPPGAIDVLNYLKNRKIPVILCTSSMLDNVEYYYKYFGLSEWFDKKQTVYDTGEYNSKAQMYRECAKRLNIDIKDAVVFEDSRRSIKEAIEGGVEKIVAIKKDDTPSYPEIKQVINDYTELDYSIFD